MHSCGSKYNYRDIANMMSSNPQTKPNKLNLTSYYLIKYITIHYHEHIGKHQWTKSGIIQNCQVISVNMCQSNTSKRYPVLISFNDQYPNIGRDGMYLSLTVTRKLEGGRLDSKKLLGLTKLNAS